MTKAALTRFLLRVRRVAGLKGSVDVLLTSNSEMRTLNRRFRSIDKPTDVLSFACEPDQAHDLAGEIAISVEIASRNARALGHSAVEEIKILMVHGVLHLKGHDHEHDDGEMGRVEERLRRKLGLPVGLIERASTRAPKGAHARRRSQA